MSEDFDKKLDALLQAREERTASAAQKEADRRRTEKAFSEAWGGVLKDVVAPVLNEIHASLLARNRPAVVRPLPGTAIGLFVADEYRLHNPAATLDGAPSIKFTPVAHEQRVKITFYNDSDNQPLAAINRELVELQTHRFLTILLGTK